ncbi:MAG TPA: beta-L-arabinofuranosidase domain-containing protein [Steroidobacteraceae bacterium]
MTTVSRRELLQILASVAALPGAAAPAICATVRLPRGPEPVVAERVPEVFTPLPFESQELRGLFAERMQTNVQGRLLHIDESACLSGFVHRDTAGEFDGAWVGEHAGKFLDAACNAVRYREHAGLRHIMERMAKALIASQEPDGYLGTYPAARRWTGWDVWVHKYNLIGLLSYYELTADPAALRACRGIGDLLARTFGDGPGQRDIVDAGEHIGMAATSVLEPMCRLYRFSADVRHLQFCQYVVRAYDHPHGPRIVSTLLESGSVYRVANGKAYEMLSNFNGLVDLYRLTADRPLLDAVLRAWDDMVSRQLYRTGTLSAAEHFQCDGRLLSLQSSNVGEMCVTVTWLQLNWRLLRLTGEARFGQEIERTVYNHLLAAQDGRNGNIAYYTSWAGPKEFTDALLCCVSSGPRGISLIPQLAWGLQSDALLVNLYTPGRARFQINTVPVEVLCATAFPADGEVRLTVNAARAMHFAVRLRVPEWAHDFQVKVGPRTLAGTPGQILDVRHTWSQSTTLEIRMDMPARVVSGAPTYPDYVHVERGPQVLSLERAVNSAVPYLHRVALAEADEAVAVKPAPAPQGWSGRQVYHLTGSVGLPGDGEQLRLMRHTVSLVPFADTRNGRVWLTRSERARHDRPAVTAFARVSLSVLSLGLEPHASGHIATDVPEFVTDEDPHTYCTVNPQDPGLANYLGAPLGKRGDPVWFTIMLRSPVTISRVVFRHGAVSATGGWFDTSTTLPRIELTQSPIPTSANAAVPDSGKVRWETAAWLERYPRTDAVTPPPLAAGQLFEVRLPRPLTVFGVRVVGNAGGAYASCAELSAYG